MTTSKSDKGKEVATLDNYPVLAGGGQEIMEALADNMAGEQISVFDLDQISVPAGGGLMWEVVNEDGEVDSVKELEGVVIANRPSRSYWSTGFDESGGGDPPDCSSDDLITGSGQPGGDCESCQFNQWGSGPKGNGKACRETRSLFLLLPNAMMPVVLTVPPSSLKKKKGGPDGFVNYKLRLATGGRTLHKVVTRFTLEKAQSNTGITYSRIRFSRGADLTPEQVEQIEKYIEAIRPAITPPSASGANSGPADQPGGQPGGGASPVDKDNPFG